MLQIMAAPDPDDPHSSPDLHPRRRRATISPVYG